MTDDTLLIDELDAKLHPLLLRYIINMFHNPDINKKNAQLIYSTHDIFTLTKFSTSTSPEEILIVRWSTLGENQVFSS